MAEIASGEEHLSRLVIVSNRVVDLSKAAQAGGVAVVIADVLRDREGLWFGWNGRITDASDAARTPSVRTARGHGSNATATIPLTPEEHRDYYLGYSNSVLWPVFHNRLDLARFDAGFYQRYIEVNQRFAEALVPLLLEDDTIWIHDYHLIPLASELRERGVANPIGFFLHIPVPPPQAFLAIPEHRELARDLSAYDLIGLQTSADVANLIKFLEDAVAGRILQDGRITVFDRQLMIENFPVGINLADFSGTAHLELDVQARSGAHRIIGVDRLDYTKGLPQKLSAFGRFLEKNPHYRGRVVLSQIAPPTRESVDAYTDIRSTLESLSGKINGMFGELDWVPIHYIHRSAPRKRSAQRLPLVEDRHVHAAPRRHEPGCQGVHCRAGSERPRRSHSVAVCRRGRAAHGCPDRQSLQHRGDGGRYPHGSRNGQDGADRAARPAACRHQGTGHFRLVEGVSLRPRRPRRRAARRRGFRRDDAASA